MADEQLQPDEGPGWPARFDDKAGRWRFPQEWFVRQLARDTQLSTKEAREFLKAYHHRIWQALMQPGTVHLGPIVKLHATVVASTRVEGKFPTVKVYASTTPAFRRAFERMHPDLLTIEDDGPIEDTDDADGADSAELVGLDGVPWFGDDAGTSVEEPDYDETQNW